MNRRHFIGTAALLSGCAAVGIKQTDSSLPIVVFVPGNNEHACMFTTLIWRFESNGYPAELLHALSYTHPASRSISGGDDSTPAPNRSSTTEAAEDLFRFVTAIKSSELKRSGIHRKVALVGHSRGGTVIRNMLRLHGADDIVTAVLCGAPNHGIVAFPNRALKNEFNGQGEFMKELNSVPLSRYANTRFLTIRSRDSDVFYQPDARFVGQPGVPTNVTAESPALEGATNLDFPGFDHLETALSKQTFEAMYAFIVGQAPAIKDIVPTRIVEFSGRVLDRDADGYLINKPPANAQLTIWRVQAATGARVGHALFDGSISGDGSFGPVRVASSDNLEFVLACAGRATTHIYRTPIRRSTTHLRIRPMTLSLMANIEQPVVLLRSDGYIGEMRDTATINGSTANPMPLGVNRFNPLPGQPIASTVARVASVNVGTSIVATLNGRSLRFPLPRMQDGKRTVLVAEFD